MKLKVTAGVQSGALQAQTRAEIPDSVLARVQGLVSRGVSAAEIDEDGNLIFTLTDGTRANLGRVVGQDGRDGATIGKVWIDEYGALWITYGPDADGSTTVAQLGYVVGSPGRDGTDGDSVRSATITEDGELVLTIGNGLAAYDCNVGKVVGPRGAPGYTPVKGVDYFTEADKQEIAEAAAEIVEESGGGSGGGYTIGAGLKLDTATNTLSVDTTDSVEADNTKPITSAAVASTVGNIEVILGTI